ncbi:MAG: NAD(P)/FAD-dependent oxidoreductase [Candidatus Marinimicrobia bacterium]|nr:NAD(P)/FAD-dependent oxidoreductase [Candidatus Neomarinimicrobiota bacterium]MCF7827440.1 NAD(P)/FAD-dependent oxidoreductase [Candidatus Neomarinimicrobiota bacterium]MCF7882315.1 NAD(P)/FAD-dependent oxidoreductase [Candidatus Neomarinimicrobiota bacterium]
MRKYTYLIIGGGMTADAAIRGIRQVDSAEPVGLLSAENHLPYNRPPLSKGLWTGMDEEKIWRHTDSQDADIHLETVADSINPVEKIVTDSSGNQYGYEKLLLATGGSPIQLPDSPDGVIYFRDLDDYQTLRKLTEQKDAFTVIGGGFIGSEIAAALHMQDKDVTIIFPEDGIGDRIFPEELSNHLNEYYAEKGVRVRTGELADSIQKKDEEYVIQTDSGDTLTTDVVVAGLGIRPNTGLAESAGLDINDGILVDKNCRTSHPDIFAAGDVARFFNSALEEQIRVEHEENANIQGMIAGVNMAGADREYDYLPFFYSDLFDYGYEAVGRTSSELDIVTDWDEKFDSGVFYYLDENRVKGILLWNTWGQIEHARELIGFHSPIAAEDLMGRLPKEGK